LRLIDDAHPSMATRRGTASAGAHARADGNGAGPNRSPRCVCRVLRHRTAIDGVVRAAVAERRTPVIGRVNWHAVRIGRARLVVIGRRNYACTALAGRGYNRALTSVRPTSIRGTRVRRSPTPVGDNRTRPMVGAGSLASARHQKSSLKHRAIVDARENAVDSFRRPSM
jgi:hypothetical protein